MCVCVWIYTHKFIYIYIYIYTYILRALEPSFSIRHLNRLFNDSWEELVQKGQPHTHTHTHTVTMLLKIDTLTRDKVLNEAVCNSHTANTLRKAM